MSHCQKKMAATIAAECTAGLSKYARASQSIGGTYTHARPLASNPTGGFLR